MSSKLFDISNPGALGGPLAGISFVAGIVYAMATAKSPYPRPGAKPEDVKKYFNGSSTSARVSVAGQLISTLGLISFTNELVNMAGRGKRSSRALQALALAGGGLAVLTLVTSALTSASLTREQPDVETIHKLHNRAFILGGPLHGAGLGILMGVLGLAGLRSGELPRKLSIACLSIAPVGIASPLSLALKPAMPVIPIGRFSALLLSAIAGFRLSRQAH